MRPLSVASIPSENEVLLGTRTGKEASEFKKTLINLKKGETLKMRGPFGIFKFQDESSPVVLFASGVGITPIRAMLKSLSKSNSRPVHLVYVANGYHLFDDELLELSQSLNNFYYHKLNHSQEAIDLMTKLAREFGNKAYYFNSGSPKVLESMKEDLMANGIHKRRIIHDAFNGY